MTRFPVDIIIHSTDGSAVTITCDVGQRDWPVLEHGAATVATIELRPTRF